MSHIPESTLARRREVSERFLQGEGIEIGALHHALWFDRRQVRVRYVDRLAVPELRRQYPELAPYHFAPVDVIDDGEQLTRFADDSVDFIIGNHMLEHCENPLGTMRAHLRRVRPGGILYYAVPDKRFSFDVERALTTWEHLVRDDQEGPACSRESHYEEWARLVNRHSRPEDIRANVEALREMEYSIHFHVWDSASFRAFLDGAAAYLSTPFRVECFDQNDTEVLTVLRRTHGTLFAHDELDPALRSGAGIVVAGDLLDRGEAGVPAHGQEVLDVGPE